VLAQLDWFDGHYHCLLNMEQGMLVLHPDVLLSGAAQGAPAKRGLQAPAACRPVNKMACATGPVVNKVCLPALTDV
jgi:hypothetical protein